MLKPKRAKSKKVTTNKSNLLNFELAKIYPKTDNQQKAFDLYDEGKNLLLYGSAGSGKSFLALYFGLRDLINNGSYNKIVIIRSAVPCREIGFLKGSIEEKLEPLSAPYKSIINELFGRDDSFSILASKSVIEFESTSYLRGITYNNTLVIADEIENMNDGELSTIYTRIGLDSRLILCGDIKQCDLNARKELSGMNDIVEISKRMESFGLVEFTIDDICRSGFVKEFLIAKEELGL